MSSATSVSDFQPRLASPATGVIVTGGASGLGRASAEALAAVGRPVALWDIDGDGAKAVAEAIIRDHGVQAIGITADLAHALAIGPAARATRAALPAIGGIVHAAGVSGGRTGIDALTVANWDMVMGLHVRAAMLIVQAFHDDLRRNPGSAVVLVGSINASLGNGNVPAYTAAKGGVIALGKSLADALADDGIRVNTISPGMIATPMMEQAMPTAAIRSATVRRILLGRMGEAAEIGRAVRFLLSDEASYVTACEFVVDGGNITSQRH